jgi:hypothetical protein
MIARKKPSIRFPLPPAALDNTPLSFIYYSPPFLFSTGMRAFAAALLRDGELQKVRAT